MEEEHSDREKSEDYANKVTRMHEVLPTSISANSVELHMLGSTLLTVTCGHIPREGFGGVVLLLLE